MQNDGGIGMKIAVLMGSPNRKGSTSMLVDSFVNGATEAGHDCEVVDVCHADISPCTGCVACGYEGPCVQHDDVEEVRAKLLSAGMVVFATPLYYYGMSAQRRRCTRMTTPIFDAGANPRGLRVLLRVSRSGSRRALAWRLRAPFRGGRPRRGTR